MRDLNIAYGGSCTAKKWSNKKITYEELCDRLRNTIRTPESAEEYRKMGRREKEQAKDKGGFVGGVLREGRRKRDHVVSRSMLTLDLDAAQVDFIEKYELLGSYVACLYTTHGHIPEAPRLRLIIPLTRDISPDEYQAIGRLFADEWGIDQFDRCSYAPHQLMYWPTTPADGEYIFKEFEGEWLDPDLFLSAYPNWRDPAQLPTAKNESGVRENNGKKLEDPLTKSGIVGVFCREFGIDAVMEKFLEDVYAPAEGGRYQYREADSVAGVVVYDNKFAYSHHASDPAADRLLNAFDLVRVHRFGDEETDKKSFQKMSAFALEQPEVKKRILEEKRLEAGEDFGEDWTKELAYNKSGELANTLSNILLILENDEALKGIVFNELADGIEIREEVPWRHPARFWRDADDSQLVCYVEQNYGNFSKRNYDVAVSKVADDRSYHPIKDYFDSIPPWDGEKRVETLLVDYLGAEDNPYVRAVTKKTLCAAHARIYNPGIKFDSMLVLNGAQGIGKSTLIAALGMSWFSDSLALSDMNDKTAAEKLQGYWILEIGELAGMKKADIDKVKAFISRQDDKYRASFGRRVTPHPRQCIFFGTTNSENGYLRDITGNRRFWNVKVTGQGKKKPWELGEEDVKQIWAEVKVMEEKGEELYLNEDLETYAKCEQRAAMENDEREGLVREYLEMLLPEDWDEMDIYRRREYVRDKADPTRPVGTVRRKVVSNMEIWCECFGKNKEDLRASDSYAIAAIMVRIEGWEKNGGRLQLPIYGRQRVYVRVSTGEEKEEGKQEK